MPTDHQKDSYYARFTGFLTVNARTIASTGTFALATLLSSNSAQAHVKWFASFDVAAEPTPLYEVLTPVFWVSVVFAGFVIVLCGLLERHPVGRFVHATLDHLVQPLAERMDDVMRAGSAAFFIALWVMGGVYLTPELKTNLEWVPWLQAAIALCLFFRSTMPLSALGIFVLWGMALSQYGLFHMLDYPIFLATAVYFALYACKEPFLHGLRFGVVRWGAAITLMWASIEKFAYPQWTTPVLINKPYLSAGFDADTFMTLAGVVEFGLAFALICSPLPRRLAASVLAILFIAAVIPFGKIDAIGHLVIILILMTIIGEKASVIAEANWATNYKIKFAALACFFVCYYAGHAALFSTHNHDRQFAAIEPHAPGHGDHDHPPGTPPHNH